MLYTNANTALNAVLSTLLDAVDKKIPHYTELSRTGDFCTYLLPQSLEMTLDVEHNFPLIETKHVSFKHILVETLWYLTGSENIKMLKDNNVKIWNNWATEEGNLGPVYGVQWRSFNGTGHDQIKAMLDTAVKYPNSRQNLVFAWNPLVLPDPTQTAQENVSLGNQALPPCHTLFKIRVHPMPKSDKRYLSMHVLLRSTDSPIGLPYNIASYGLLLNLFAKVLGFTPKYLTMSMVEPHIYHIGNHVDETRKQVSGFLMNRTKYMNSQVKLNLPDNNPDLTPLQNLMNFSVDNVSVENYNGDKSIKFSSIAV